MNSPADEAERRLEDRWTTQPRVSPGQEHLRRDEGVSSLLFRWPPRTGSFGLVTRGLVKTFSNLTSLSDYTTSQNNNSLNLFPAVKIVRCVDGCERGSLEAVEG